MIESVLFLPKVGKERDRAKFVGRRLENPERDRNDRGTSFHRNACEAVRVSRLDLNVARLPSHAATMVDAWMALLEALVVRRSPQSPHDAIELLPEIVQSAQPSVHGGPTLTADVDARQRCLVQHAGELRRTPVDELGAQLDRHRGGTVSSSEDAASNALPFFDHDDIEPRIRSVRAAVTPAAPPPMTSTSAFNFFMACAGTGRSCADCDRLGGATSAAFVYGRRPSPCTCSGWCSPRRAT
jgi:hypothetical protein